MMRLESVAFPCALITLLGCSTTPASPTPDRAAPDVAPPDVAAPDVAAPDVAPDAAVDADAAAPDALPCDLDVPAVDGATTGYLRFANLTRGAGTLRFTARNLPMFREAFIEAIVPEGTASAQVPTAAVAYEIRVTPAPGQDAGISADVSTSDAGMLTVGPDAGATPCSASAVPGELVAPACTDVYAAASCTVVLAGSPTGDTALRQERRLWRFPDLAARGDTCATGRVRVVSWFASGPALNADIEGGAPLARNAAYAEATGLRVVPAGALRVAVRSAESSDAYGVLPAGAVLGAHAMTLHLWGDARDATQRAPAALLLDDLPPAR